MKTVLNHFLLMPIALLSSIMCVCPVVAGEKYNDLDDAALAQAKIWQSGGKARAVMSSDGKIVFPFGQAMPKLTCSPSRACDVEMEPGEKTKKIILGDSANWTWDGAESIERNQTVQHIIFQPRDKEVESNVIITTDRRTYHIRLYSPSQEGAYLNRVGFYYPQELVASWAARMGQDEAKVRKDEEPNVFVQPVSPEKLAFDYELDGSADFKPIRVFNNGERTYLEMPSSLSHGENPILIMIDEKDKEMVINYRREIDPATSTIHYVVDKLFDKAELRRGTETVKISWKRKQKPGFFGRLVGG